MPEILFTKVLPHSSSRAAKSQTMPTTATSTPPVDPASILIEDKYYSAEQLAQMHPGGPLFLKAFAGRDATQAFLSYHRRRFPHSRYASYKPSVK